MPPRTKTPLEINYQGKIIIYEGGKAKVINATWNQLTVIFQEKGKYHGKIKNTTKRNVELLDIRKQPKKYPFSAKEEQLENNLQAFQQAPWTLTNRLNVINHFESLEGNEFHRHQYNRLLLKLKKEHYHAAFKNLQEEFNKSPEDEDLFHLLKSYLTVIKNLGIHKEEYQKLILQITEKYYSSTLEDILGKLKRSPKQRETNTKKFYEILWLAKDIGMDTSHYEKILEKVS